MPQDGSDEEMVAFRLAPADRSAIERLVAMGEFRNRSDFFRYAVKSTLRDHPTARAALDLSLNGVELPESLEAPPSARGRTSGARNPRGRSR